MGIVSSITRRTFLIGSSAIAGGVAFGIFAARQEPENPLVATLEEGEVTFNPWVLIDSEKVTLIAPHGDKGQGVLSTQAALIAEEMDLDWGDFDVSFGEPSGAYWNRGFAEEGVPFMSTDDSRMAETMRGIVGGITKLAQVQGTGGSTSMPDSYVKLREAGAMARETLKAAASAKTGVPVSDLKTEMGKVILPDGSELKYTDLAADAADITPIKDTPLRDPSEWKYLGKPMERLDIVAKSTGTMMYGADLSVDGMKFATVCVNPRQGGEMLGFDATAAEALPGVEKVFPITNGVAAVASNTWYAIQAVRAVEFDWGPAPYPAEQDAHWTALENSFGEENLDSEWRNDGDVTTVEGEKVEAEYRSPYVAHAPLEPMNAIVKVTDDGVEIWTGHQMPIFLTQQVAAVAGIEPEQVTFHNQFMGGSFGHRLEFEHIKQAVEVAMEMKGTPVKMTYSREEDFAHDFPRHISMGRCTGVHADGKVVGLDVAVASPSVLASQGGRLGQGLPGPDSQIAAGAWNNPYGFDNYRMRAYRAPELAPVSSWRAVGANGAGFIFDTILDETIHAAGADPLEERIRLMDHEPSRIALETVGEMSSWGGELAPNQGRGVAYVESFGVPTAQVVQVTNDDGFIKIDKVWIALDVGRVLDPVNFENLVQGGVVFGLGHAMNSEITYSDGMALQTNYHAHEAMRLYQTPEIFVRGLENQPKMRGVGEPPVPVAAPSLGNAIFAATGQRIREMPFNKYVDFV